MTSRENESDDSPFKQGPPVDINTNPQKLLDSGNSSQPDEITVDPFIIDIALGSKKFRVRLEPGTDPEQLAADFCAEHGLDQRLQEKLVIQLNKNVRGLYAVPQSISGAKEVQNPRTPPQADHP